MLLQQGSGRWNANDGVSYSLTCQQHDYQQGIYIQNGKKYVK